MIDAKIFEPMFKRAWAEMGKSLPVVIPFYYTSKSEQITLNLHSFSIENRGFDEPFTGFVTMDINLSNKARFVILVEFDGSYTQLNGITVHRINKLSHKYGFPRLRANSTDVENILAYLIMAVF
jgi:hypothetical protein